jgi:hypothetical protein
MGIRKTKPKGAYLALVMLPLLTSLSLTASATTLPDTLTMEGTELALNGSGTRTKFFMDLYVGGLYLTTKNEDAVAISQGREIMAIKLHVVSRLITSERMKEATLEGFELSLDGKTEPLQKQIDTFIAVFDEEISENDVFDLLYSPGIGVKILKNGKFQASIAGHEFKEALFGIWLSERPVQKSLKRKMLGL